MASRYWIALLTLYFGAMFGVAQPLYESLSYMASGVQLLTQTESENMDVGLDPIQDFRCSHQTSNCPTSSEPYNPCAAETDAGSCLELPGGACYRCSTGYVYRICFPYPEVECTENGASSQPCGFVGRANCYWNEVMLQCFCGAFGDYSEEVCPKTDCTQG